MKLVRTGLRSAVLCSVAFSAFGLGNAASAQTAPPPDNNTPNSTDIVVVTGSLIKREAETAPAPLIQVTQEQLLESGQPNLVDYLADIPALSGSTVPEDTTGSNLNDGGLSLLNLRDLGSARTLVLVDGRRHVGAPQGGTQVDVDTIPKLLINSVEIVTGGQSSIYGADAVSGVVNFIMKNNFDGIEADGALAEINKSGGDLNRRLSTLMGKNFLDGRGNVYLSAEWERGDEVKDSEVKWRRDAWTLLNNDSDPASAPSDGDYDNILIRGARDAFFNRGGLVLLSSMPKPSPASDPDIPFAACATASATFTTNIAGQANCFTVGKELNSAYVFPSAGTFRPFNFGTFQDQNGASRRVNIGGDGLNVGTEFNQGSRIPSTQAQRFQIGGHFDVTNWLTGYGEVKYVTEETYDEGQPTFFQGGIGTPTANQTASIFSTSNFDVGVDNAYLPAGLKAIIAANTRPVYDSAGNLTGTVADTRATFNMFGPIRNQLNERNVTRFVVGAKGGWDQFAFFKDIAWDVGYTYGEVKNKNRELGVDVIRFATSADAVVDTAGALGTPGAVVCRATLLAKQGVAVRDQWNGGNYAANDPVITQCKPTNIFGVDLRDNQTELAGRNYWSAAIHVNHTNIQQDYLATASTKLWDFWGAGPIGLAVGYEDRKEKTAGEGRDAETAGRFLFLNTGPDFKTAEYSTQEYFGEVEIPLLKDSFLGKYAEFDASYRHSDYTTVGNTEVKAFSFQYRPIPDVMFRTSYGTSIRVPSLSEEFAPFTQTFANGLVDPCDAVALRNFTATDPTHGANRRTNCQALLGAGYNPDTTAITYPSGVPGVQGGNINLKPEESRSYTHSLVFTPSFLPEASFVVDYYDIRIDNVIAAVTVQSALNQCVNDAALNPNACNTLTRDSTFKLASFVQGSVNFASTLSRGIDFTANYGVDLADVVGMNLGHLRFNLRGNYLIKQQDFVNFADPSIATNNDSIVGQPRVRYLFTTTYEPTDKLKIAWAFDWQSEQEILNYSAFTTDPDNRNPEYANTTPFVQNDITVTYDIFKNFRLRGGVVNLFDTEPDKWLGSTTTADNFDLFGRRFFIGFNYKY